MHEVSATDPKSLATNDERRTSFIAVRLVEISTRAFVLSSVWSTLRRSSFGFQRAKEERARNKAISSLAWLGGRIPGVGVSWRQANVRTRPALR